MNTTSPRSPLLSLLALVAACDVRADERYPGDSLLHLEGRVILEDHDGQGLVPALAFDTENGYEIVEVQGSFPNNFRIEVYSPPPEAARVNAREDLDLPPGAQIAIGYIAAVSEKHPREALDARSSTSDLPLSELAGCATAVPECQRVERWCVDRAQQECRIVGLPCDGEDTCEPTASEGNSAIFYRAIDAFAGLSERIVIMWTRDGLPKSSIFSHRFGIEQDLKPGYNLVELGEPKPDPDDEAVDDTCTNCGAIDDTSEAESCSGDQCDDPFLAEALARYNAAYGTDYATLDAAYADFDTGPDASDAEFEALIAFEKKFFFYHIQVQIDHGVDVSESSGARVIEDWHTPLVIHVGPDIDPLI